MLAIAIGPMPKINQQIEIIHRKAKNTASKAGTKFSVPLKYTLLLQFYSYYNIYSELLGNCIRN